MVSHLYNAQHKCNLLKLEITAEAHLLAYQAWSIKCKLQAQDCWLYYRTVAVQIPVNTSWILLSSYQGWTNRKKLKVDQVTITKEVPYMNLISKMKTYERRHALTGIGMSNQARMDGTQTYKIHLKANTECALAHTRICWKLRNLVSRISFMQLQNGKVYPNIWDLEAVSCPCSTWFIFRYWSWGSWSGRYAAVTLYQEQKFKRHLLDKITWS